MTAAGTPDASACLVSGSSVTHAQSERTCPMTVSKADLDKALAYADAHMGDSLDRLKQLIAIKSISTDPAYAAECKRAADWIVADLASEGFDAAARPTPGHPVVVAHAPKV